MIEEQAIVVRIDGSHAFLEVERSKPCGLCGTSTGCGLSLWGRLFAGRHGHFSVDNSLGLAVGERVVVSMEEGALVTGALAMYLVPVLMLCAGAFVGAGLGVSRMQSDLFAAAGAVAGLSGGLFLVYRAPRFLVRQHTVLRRSENMIVRQCSKVIT